jgi:hypothetical protein
VRLASEPQFGAGMTDVLPAVEVTLFQAESWRQNWPPVHMDKFIAWLQEQLSKIPPPFRASAKIEIESEGGYDGDHNATITIKYWRPETPDETQRRIAEIDRTRSLAEVRERELLKSLQDKYGSQR